MPPGLDVSSRVESKTGSFGISKHTPVVYREGTKQQRKIMTMKPLLIAVTGACVARAAGCNSVKPEQAADTIYTGGNIITVNDAQPSAEAVAVKDGKIRTVGSTAEVEKVHRGQTTKTIDLAGKTLVPGFLDPHSHYINSLSVANQVNIMAPPGCPGKDIARIVVALKQFRDQHKIPPGVLIQAYGYDENAMPNGVGLTRDDLDKDFPDNPVMVGHVSMQLSGAQFGRDEEVQHNRQDENPRGRHHSAQTGVQRASGPADGDRLSAYLTVSALPQPTREEEVEWSRAGQMLYAASGITTAKGGPTHQSDVALMQRAAAAGVHIVDVVSYPFILDLDAVLKNNPASSSGTYVNHVKLWCVKITMDGSPQGKTAYSQMPYLTGGPAGQKNWRGEPSLPGDGSEGDVQESV